MDAFSFQWSCHVSIRLDSSISWYSDSDAKQKKRKWAPLNTSQRTMAGRKYYAATVDFPGSSKSCRG